MEYQVSDMQPGEEVVLLQLFHQTVHTVNRRDYSPAQLAAWSPELSTSRQAEWQQRIQHVAPFCARAKQADSSVVVGFADVQADGLVDFFFVHHAWQGQGVAGSLMAEIEARAAAADLPELHAYVSLTAQPFFQHCGFSIVHRQTVHTRGVDMDNYLMRRHLSTNH